MRRPTPERAPAATRRAPDPEEALLGWIWQRRLLREPWLTLTDGSRLRVVFAGRRWGGAGPDLRGAVLERPDGTLLRGDVELHAREGDWRVHGHDRDPDYAAVALHVVWRPAATAARRLDGSVVPTLVLDGQLAAPLGLLRARHAAAEPGPVLPACVSEPRRLAALLDTAGAERFQERAAALEGDLSCVEVEALLYRELLAAMGYSRNKEPCRRLAELVPLAELRCVLAERPPAQRAEIAQALLLGRAGLLPAHAQALPEGLWRAWQALDDGRPSPLRGSWRRDGARPANSPTRRIAGLALWLAERLTRDWAADLEQAVRRAASRRTSAELAELFRVCASDAFWPSHADFARPMSGAQPWLIGRGRAMEMVVSVLLPVMYALGDWRRDETLSAAALRCYRRFPATPGNRITRAMAEQVGDTAPRGPRLSACRQQGLLHLYRRWCAERWCERCPAGAAAARLELRDLGRA